MTDGKDLKIGTWNVEGLLNRLDSSDFVSFLKSFDICCLTETFIDYEFQCEQLSHLSHLFLHLQGNFHIEVENLEV